MHSSVVRTIRNQLAESGENTKVVCVGDKSRAILQRLFAKNIIMVASEVGRLSPTFLDAAKLAQAILNSGYQFTSGEIVFNRFRTVVSYKTQQLPIYSLAAVQVSDVEIVDYINEKYWRMYSDLQVTFNDEYWWFCLDRLCWSMIILSLKLLFSCRWVL